jgi:hypothetical protein
VSFPDDRAPLTSRNDHASAARLGLSAIAAAFLMRDAPDHFKRPPERIVELDRIFRSLSFTFASCNAIARPATHKSAQKAALTMIHRIYKHLEKLYLFEKACAGDTIPRPKEHHGIMASRYDMTIY